MAPEIGTEGSNLTLSLPLPPPYYKYYTDDNVAKFEQGKNSQESRDELDPASSVTYFLNPPPPIEGTYTTFGIVRTTTDGIVPLKEQGIPQLYPDGAIDRGHELKELNKSLLITFLEMINVLTKRPILFTKYLDHIRNIAINMHHLLNEYRPHQARDTLRFMLENQIKRRRATIDKTRECRKNVQDKIKECKFWFQEATKFDINSLNQSDEDIINILPMAEKESNNYEEQVTRLKDLLYPKKSTRTQESAIIQIN